MAAGKLRAVVCTSTLDLGIDWGDVDLVIHVGAPKGASRLLQRIGRANHRLDEPSQGDPGAGQPLRGAGMPRRARRRRGRRAGHAAARAPARSTCWPSTSSACACARAVRCRRALCRGRVGRALCRPRRARPSTASSISSRPAAMRCRAYERFASIRQTSDGTLARRASARRPAIPAERRHHRRSADAEGAAGARARRRRATGAIGAAAACSARSRNISSRRWRPATPSSSPARSCASRASRENEVYRLARQRRRSQGAVLCGRQVSALDLSRRARARHARRSERAGSALPDQVREWLATAAATLGAAAAATSCWSRPFRAATGTTWSAYPFEGRLAHQTLGMLLTRRLERARLRPARLRRQRLCAGGLGPRRHRRDASRRGELDARRPVRRGHAGRRSRGLAGRI